MSVIKLGVITETSTYKLLGSKVIYLKFVLVSILFTFLFIKLVFAQQEPVSYDIEELTKYSDLIIVGHIRGIETKDDAEYMTVKYYSKFPLKGQLLSNKVIIKRAILKGDYSFRQEKINLNRSYFFFLKKKDESDLFFNLISEYDGVISFNRPVRREVWKYEARDYSAELIKSSNIK